MNFHAMAMLHTRLFGHCLEGMDDEAAGFRINGSTNSAAFIAAHLVDSRAWAARMLGVDVPAPFGGTVAYGSSLDALESVPTLAESTAEWHAISPVLIGRLDALTPADLTAIPPTRFPIGDATVAGALTFLLHHEAYHIGQLALLRRAVGLPAMTYVSRP